MKKAAIATAIFLSSTSLVIADDDGAPVWKSVGEWEIRVDTSLGNGCFMVGSYTQGEVIRLGLDRNNSHGYIMMGKAVWSSLTVGNKYPIALTFGTNVPWDGNATAIDMSGSTMLYMSFDGPTLMQEFADSNVLQVEYKGQTISRLPLTGTRAAVDELVNCQDIIDKKFPPKSSAPSQSQSDPFAEPAVPNDSDPFKH